MRWIAFISILCLNCQAFTQIGTGQWRLHVSPTETVDVVAGNGVIMAAYPSGLLEYDVAAAERTLWTDVNSLSDINLTALFFDEASGAFWIGYANGNIDKIKGNTVTNIPAIKMAQIQGDKQVNKFYAHNGFIYVSTGLGIVKINPAKDEVADTYYPNSSTEPIMELVIREDSIFALTSKKVFRGYLNDVALADPSRWTIDSRIPDAGPNASYKGLVMLENDLFVAYGSNVMGSDSVYRVTNGPLEMVVGDIFDLEISRIKVVNNNLYVILGGGILYYDHTFATFNSINTYSFSSTFRSNNVTYYDGKHYIADEDHGLVYYQNHLLNGPLNAEGPSRNSFYTLGGTKEKIAVAGGTLQETSFAYNLAGAYILKDEKWQLFDVYNQPAWDDINLWDIGSVSINPKNTDEIAFGSYSGAPLSIVKDGSTVSSVFTPDNSILEATTLGNGASCVSDVEYDEFGNLWIANGYSNKPLKVLTADGLWYDFDLGSAGKSKLTGRMVIDYNNNKWFYARGAGLFGYKDNKTISDPSDDKYKLINSGENTGALPSSNVTALAVDFDNEIWIGTDNGFAILYNSDAVFDALPGQYNAQRIKLKFEGNVEYLLGNTYVTDIEIDGGNRKWIGTANTGIFLLSPDGLEILASFTKENSPLISNNIMDMQFNHQTGELFIITDKGLLSYRTDASYEDPEYSNVQVFPNPVKPEYSGIVTIQGIKYNSDVNVTDVAGNLVYKTTSNGGTATWDGKNLQGERVKGGVYLIWTASNQGKGRKVGKVTVIN